MSSNAGRRYDLGTIPSLADVNYIETLYHMSQPAWMTDKTVATARNLTQKFINFLFGIGTPSVPELTKLRGGKTWLPRVRSATVSIHYDPPFIQKSTSPALGNARIRPC